MNLDLCNFFPNTPEKRVFFSRKNFSLQVLAEMFHHACGNSLAVTPPASNNCMQWFLSSLGLISVLYNQSRRWEITGMPNKKVRKIPEWYALLSLSAVKVPTRWRNNNNNNVRAHLAFHALPHWRNFPNSCTTDLIDWLSFIKYTRHFYDSMAIYLIDSQITFLSNVTLFIFTLKGINSKRKKKWRPPRKGDWAMDHRWPEAASSTRPSFLILMTFSCPVIAVTICRLHWFIHQLKKNQNTTTMTTGTRQC